MNRKRLGQVLISGVFTVCALVIAALTELAAKEGQTPKNEEHAPEEQMQNNEREEST
jgi:ribosomal protein L12E/L44/L45/RPP1/RPP2